LNGGLRENATGPFRKILPDEFHARRDAAGVKLISQMMVRTGITSSTDAQATPEDLLGIRTRARPASCRSGCTA
jgi:hypothetical protein